MLLPKPSKLNRNKPIQDQINEQTSFLERLVTVLEKALGGSQKYVRDVIQQGNSIVVEYNDGTKKTLR